MTELIRPSLYEAHHPILQVEKKKGATVTADVVGPVCESGDFLGLNRTFQNPEIGDLLAIECAGAYGSTMASHYNTRPRVSEILVQKHQFLTIRKGELFQQVWQLEELF
jgi:diaminopimelate decarboxylase